jgi:hypothetical protein
MDSHSITLSNLYAYPYILVPGQQNRIADCTESRQLDEVSHYQRVDPFLLTDAVDESQPYLDIIEMGQLLLFKRWAKTQRAIVPVQP